MKECGKQIRGDFPENVVEETAIPKESKNETEQIQTATTEVRQQGYFILRIWSILTV